MKRIMHWALDAYDVVQEAGGPFGMGFLDDGRPAVYCRDGVVTVVVEGA